jgi:hypothetical protein
VTLALNFAVIWCSALLSVLRVRVPLYMCESKEIITDAWLILVGSMKLKF